MEPAHLVAETLGARRDAERELGQRGDVTDGEHWTRGPRRYSRSPVGTRVRHRDLRHRVQPAGGAVAPRAIDRAEARWERIAAVSLSEQTVSARVIAERERYVARGVSTPPLVVGRAEGARIEDVDGRSYIDFAGGIGCQNLGHGHARGRRGDPRAGRPLPAPVLHGRHLRAVRRGLPAARRAVAVPRRRAEVAARQLRRRGGRERRQDRARRDRPPGGGRLRQRVPRADAADDDDDRKVVYKKRLRPVRARGLPRAGAVPVPRHLDRRRDRRARAAASRPRSTRRRSPASCSSRCRARAASSRCRPTSRARLQELCARARDPLRRRRGPVRRRPHRAGVGDRALRRRSPTCSSRASRSAAGCRWRRSPAAPSHGRRRTPAGSAARSAATRVSCAAAAVVLDAVADAGVPRAGAGARRDGCAPGSTTSPTRVRRDRRGARPRADARARARRTEQDAATGAAAVVAAACERGLLLLSCGLVRQRDPAAAAARRSRTTSSSAGLADPGGVACRCRLSGEPDGCGARRQARRPAQDATATSLAVDGVDLEIRRGEFFTMLGPSGSGKTTTLRLIARLRAARRRHGSSSAASDVSRAAAVRARRQHRLPGLRALPAHDRARERRVRPAGEEGVGPSGAARQADEALDDGAARRATATASRRSSRAASASASRSRARSSTARRCCCSTSRSARST